VFLTLKADFSCWALTFACRVAGGCIGAGSEWSGELAFAEILAAVRAVLFANDLEEHP
jgi:hypothetical protein